MVGLSIFNPIIGGWLDSAKKSNATAAGYPVDASLDGQALADAFSKIPKEAMNKIELAAGQATLANIAIIPLLLIVAFAFLYFLMRNQAQPKAAH